MKKDVFGDRMKAYEDVTRYHLTRRTPVIVRVDGKAFHTFTKNFSKPFSYELMSGMDTAATELVRQVEGCQLAYVQSDEISLLLTDYAKLDTQAWFGNNLLKICSVSASIATSAFNHYFKSSPSVGLAHFDARAFNVPKEEVCNYFIWRQKDCMRNAVSMVAHSLFSHNSLQNLSTLDLIEKLKAEKDYDLENDLEPHWRFGRLFLKPSFLYRGAPAAPLFTETRQIIEEFV